MSIDIRAEAARYYDLNPSLPDDVDFYRRRIRSPTTTVLELGCGTGRVLVPLAKRCARIHGVDASDAMIARCQRRLVQSGVGVDRASAEVGDICHFDLGQEFDLITAPFRVFQNLETDADVDGAFETIRRHLAPGARCILNVFNPNRDRESLQREWLTNDEYLCWETAVEGDRVTCHGRNPRMDSEKTILFPELTYRTYRSGKLVEEVTLPLVMRCYYPEEFERLIAGRGFRIRRRWGGYAGEAYGHGPELVIEFGRGT